MDVVADREGDEVRRRRLVELPRRGRALGVADELRELAVGDAGPLRRGVDGDVVQRLVGRLVVDGVPGVGAIGLLHRPHLARAGHREAGRAEVAARRRGRGRLGRADVVEAELVALVLLDRSAQHEVLAAPGEGDRLAVEGDLADGEAGSEVELEAARRAGRPEGDDRRAGEVLVVGLPGQVEVVVQRVDARVADSGVDAVLARRRHGEVEVDRLRVAHHRTAGGAVRRLVVGRLGGRRLAVGRRGRRRRVLLLLRAGGPTRARSQDGEGQGRRQHPANAVVRHRSPRSSGRASLRPWWICALTVPSGASTSVAISSYGRP